MNHWPKKQDFCQCPR
uniref:Uncharacterized protein n=1 Tax=Rhizophora mucronata TaxID=61149 RepID=A0A2P2IM60_RHIMU